MFKILGLIKLILAILAIALASWLLIHIIAIFGIFLAIAFPVLWLLIPKYNFCLICHTRRVGDWCPLCKKQVNKTQGLHPIILSSALYNAALILTFSLISIGIIFGESQLLLKSGFPPTPKTVYFVIPDKGQYRIGEIFPMKIEITGIKTPVNAVQADIGFDTNKLEVVDISTKDSFANIFIQKEINNQAGYARLTGGLPNPGFFSDKGSFGIIYFKAKNPGLTKIDFLPTSLVLANDGRGSNVIKKLSSASYLILPEKISHEEENLQKNVTIGSKVLGTSTDNTQMIFYEENKVLGAHTDKEIQTTPKPNIFSTLLNSLSQIDTFIVEQYSKLLKPV